MTDITRLVDDAAMIANETLSDGEFGIWDLYDREGFVLEVQEHIDRTKSVPRPTELAQWLIEEVAV